MRKEITTGIIVFRKTKEGTKFLVLYHGHRYWNFPKGHIENEEQSLEAAFRETFEETGLKQEELRLVRNFKTYERFTFRRAGQSVYKIVILYLAQTNNPIIKISKEHQGYGWFLYEDAKHILGKHKDSQRVIQQAYDHLTRGSRRPLPDSSGAQAPTAQPPQAAHTPRPHAIHQPRHPHARQQAYRTHPTNNHQREYRKPPYQNRPHHPRPHHPDSATTNHQPTTGQ